MTNATISAETLIEMLRSGDVTVIVDGSAVVVDRLVRTSTVAMFSGYSALTYDNVDFSVPQSDISTVRFELV